MTFSIGADHAGYLYKAAVIEWLEAHGHTVIDHGTNAPDSVDYPDFVHPVAQDLEAGTAERGVVICGSGQGVTMTANKHQHVRAALCWQVPIAELARQHNDANVLALPARFVAKELALQMLEAFVNTEFEGGRHARRVGKISCG